MTWTYYELAYTPGAQTLANIHSHAIQRRSMWKPL